jgi:bla regulator protein blaR1
MTSGLMATSVTGSVAVAAVWLVCRLVPRLSAGARAVLWWCVAAKFLLGLVWVAPVRLPILPGRVGPVVLAGATLAVPPADAGQAARALDPDAGAASSQGDDAIDGVLPSVSGGVDWTGWMWRGWSFLLAALWMGGIAIAGLAFGLGWRRARQLLRRSTEAPLRVQPMTVALAHSLALSRAPDVRISDDVDTPLVVGLRRASVLLPRGLIARLSDRELQMAICHELVHIKRADLSLGCVPALVKALFFFHPFAIVAVREYGLAREAACDAAVLHVVDAAPAEYGRMLVGLGVARRRMAFAAGGAAVSRASLERRLLMLRDAAPRSRAGRVAGGLAAGLVVMGLMATGVVARPAAPPARSGRAAAAGPTAPPVAVRRAVAPRAALQAGQAPKPVQKPQATSGAATVQGPDFVLFRDDDTVAAGGLTSAMRMQMRLLPRVQSQPSGIAGYVLVPRPVTAQTSSGDGTPASRRAAIAHARTFRKSGEGLLWFRWQGAEYVVRDAATLQEADRIVRRLEASEPGAFSYLIRPTSQATSSTPAGRAFRVVRGPLVSLEPLVQRAIASGLATRVGR